MCGWSAFASSGSNGRGMRFVWRGREDELVVDDWVVDYLLLRVDDCLDGDCWRRRGEWVCGIGEGDPCLPGSSHALPVVHAGRYLLLSAGLIRGMVVLLFEVVFGQLGLYFIALHFNYNQHTLLGRH